MRFRIDYQSQRRTTLLLSVNLKNRRDYVLWHGVEQHSYAQLYGEIWQSRTIRQTARPRALAARSIVHAGNQLF